MSTLTTNGQVGAATPQNLGEMAFTAVLMVLTVTIFNYVLGEITNVIMAQDAALVATRAQARSDHDIIMAGCCAGRRAGRHVYVALEFL